MLIVSLEEAEARFEELIALVETGTSIGIASEGRPLVKLVPEEDVAIEAAM